MILAAAFAGQGLNNATQAIQNLVKDLSTGVTIPDRTRTIRQERFANRLLKSTWRGRLTG